MKVSDIISFIPALLSIKSINIIGDINSSNKYLLIGVEGGQTKFFIIFKESAEVYIIIWAKLI